MEVGLLRVVVICKALNILSIYLFKGLFLACVDPHIIDGQIFLVITSKDSLLIVI